MKALMRVERENLKKKIPQFSVGDTVRVHVKVVEGDKVRNQIFQGTVIGRRGGGVRETFTVRKISSNIAVERTFPIHSPNVVRIERVREGHVRRAQLTYMRDRKGKSARIAQKQVDDSGGAKAARRDEDADTAPTEETPETPETPETAEIASE
jgi:large subunit ribosomal protein L19